MPSTPLFPKNGSVVYGTTAIDFNTFELEEHQVVDDATPYGTNKMGVNVGNGTPTAQLTAAGFAKKGLTGSALGLDGTAFGATSNSSSGSVAMATLTLDTGCTEAGNMVLERMRVQHGRMRATVPVMLQARNAGDLTETWQTS